MTTAKLLAAALLSILALTVGLAAIGIVGAQVGAASPLALVARIDGDIDPVAARKLKGWIGKAESENAALLVLEIDTPGGRLDSMRDMTGALLDSPIPIVAFVAPSGARAASAGTFIVAASHVAAMSPGTTIGAASPVGSGGDELPETIKAKVSQDAAAHLRGIAAQRGRNADALEATIFEASAYSAEEARALGVVDIAQSDIPNLLSALHGWTVTVKGAEKRLSTESVRIERVEATLSQRFQEWVANPHLVFILLAVGGVLILVELISPGGWVAGVAGVALLALAVVGLWNLPMNWFGIALIVGGLALVFVELQAPGWGGFGLAGGIGIVAGGFLLFGDASVPGLPAPSYRVGWLVLGGAATFLALSLSGMFVLVRRAKSIEVVSRSSRIVGETGVVRRTLDPTGMVQAAGELWTAESDSGETIEAGESVIVAEMDGVTLKVYKTSKLNEV